MGRSNVPLMQARTLVTVGESLGETIFGTRTIDVFGWPVGSADAAVLLLALAAASLGGALLFAFFRTNIGTAMRATGDNPQMIRALGANVEGYIVLGLALSNGLVALSGALLAQYQGFADAQMGIGMVVWGLASVIIGEALTGTRSLGLTIVGAIMGSVLFRLLVAIALRWGLNPNDLKLITALFVFAALVLPPFIAKMKRNKPVAA
jgi:putative ABC transport system permease protein